MKQKLHQGQTVELEITDLNTSGEGVGRYQGQVVFVPNTVTGDRLTAKIIQSKAKFARGKITQLLTASDYRIRPGCIVADKCGGCQWQHIEPSYQRDAKEQQVVQALERIGGLQNFQVEPMLYASKSLGYRNKSTYPLARSSSGQVQAGYYRQGSHKVVNLNQCPVQDERLHPLLKEVKQDIQRRGWSIYNEHTAQGQLRHLALRIGKNTGEMLLTLVSNHQNLNGIEQQAKSWLTQYPELVGVCLNLNSQKTNAIFGRDNYTIAGRAYLKEIFAGIELHIASDTFFQVNTHAAELLLQRIIKQLNLKGNETIIDAYCGIGTFTLPIAQKVKQAWGIEVHPGSIQQAKKNASRNQIHNATFLVGKVKHCLGQIRQQPDILMLDPPRKGCDTEVIKTIRELQPSRIVYISCKPTTLARDLKLLCHSGMYQATYVQPVDFFPQTTHVECCVILTQK